MSWKYHALGEKVFEILNVGFWVAHTHAVIWSFKQELVTLLGYKIISILLNTLYILNDIKLLKIYSI